MFCEKCGREELGKARFCRGCGARLGPEQELSLQREGGGRKPTQGSEVWLRILVGFMLGFIAFAIGMFVLKSLDLLEGFNSHHWVAAAIAGVLAGGIARGFWKGALTAVLAAALGYAGMVVIGYRIEQGPSEVQLEVLSTWNSFLEMFCAGGAAAGVAGSIAGRIADYFVGRRDNDQKADAKKKASDTDGYTAHGNGVRKIIDAFSSDH